MKKGSALLSVLMTVAVLSVMVMSFVYEARRQAGINIYVRERNRVGRLIDAGRILAEIVLVHYKEAPAWSADQDMEKCINIQYLFFFF